MQGNITGITGWVMLCIIWTRNPGQVLFEKALEYRPGDEDTLEMISLCRKVLALPNAMKPFCERVKEGCSHFWKGMEAQANAYAKQGGEPVA